jgi:hypothetical protein
MNEESKKIEKKMEQGEPEVNAAELSEQELQDASGGTATAGFLKASSRVAD